MDVIPILLLLAIAAGAGYAIWTYRKRTRPLDGTEQNFGGGQQAMTVRWLVALVVAMPIIALVADVALAFGGGGTR